MEERIYKLTKLSRKIYLDCISSPRHVKALAFFLFIKSRKGASVIPNYNYSIIAELCGISRTTAKKRLEDLAGLELIDIIGYKSTHLLFKPCKHKHNNIRLDKVDFTSIKTIEHSLRALYIVEIQSRKNYVSQQMNLAANPRKLDAYKKSKKVVKKVVCGSDKKFQDNGISYKYLAKKLGVGRRNVKNAIDNGVNSFMFECKHNYKVVASFENKFDAKNIYKLDYSGDKYRVIDCSIVLILSNLYTLLPLS